MKNWSLGLQPSPTTKSFIGNNEALGAVVVSELNANSTLSNIVLAPSFFASLSFPKKESCVALTFSCAAFPVVAHRSFPLVDVKLALTLRADLQGTRRRKGKSRRQAAFLVNSFGFTKQLPGQLACSEAEVDHHLKETYSGEFREWYLGRCWYLIILLSMKRSLIGRRSKSWSKAQEQALLRAHRSDL